jgi:hypothetical protein
MLVDMERKADLSFGARLHIAWRVLVNRDDAEKAVAALAPPLPPEPPKQDPPEVTHASALWLLAALQREGRLLDFLQQEVATFSDEEIGAAARVVHSGCRKTLQQYFTFVPVRTEPEGQSVTIPPGFDSQRVRLTGNVSGQPPFRGTLKHHGWTAEQLHLPPLSVGLDARVVAPAEVELS